MKAMKSFEGKVILATNDLVSTIEGQSNSTYGHVSTKHERVETIKVENDLGIFKTFKYAWDPLCHEGDRVCVVYEGDHVHSVFNRTKNQTLTDPRLPYFKRVATGIMFLIAVVLSIIFLVNGYDLFSVFNNPYGSDTVNHEMWHFIVWTGGTAVFFFFAWRQVSKWYGQVAARVSELSKAAS